MNQSNRRRDDAPSEPWLERPAWTHPLGIAPQDPRGLQPVYTILVVVCALFAFSNLYLLIGGVAGALAAKDKPGRAGAAADGIVSTLFMTVAFGAGTVWLWRRRAARVSRTALLNRARFVPADLPIPLGGALSGRLDLPDELGVGGDGRSSIYCVRRTRRIETDEGKKVEREHAEQVGVTNSRVLPLSAWQSSGRDRQIHFSVPVPQGPPSDTAEPTLDRAIHEWRLHVELPAARGDADLIFVVPVFAVPTATSAAPEAAAEWAAPPLLPPPVAQCPEEIIAQIAMPSAPVARDRHELREIFAAGKLRFGDQPGAVGGQAVRLDPSCAFNVVLLRALGTAFVVGLVFVGAIVLPFFGSVGRYLALGPVLLALYFAACGARDMWRTWSGAVAVWAEPDAVVLRRATGKIERIQRAEIARFEIVPVGGSTTAQYFRINLAGRPAPGAALRPRRNLAEAVRTSEAAQALAHWLADALAAPRPDVIVTEEGIALMERLAGKRR